MGSIADMIINGDFDYDSGEYLGEGHGYPRTSSNHYKGYDKRSGAYGGVVNWLKYRHNTLSKSNSIVKNYANGMLNIQFISKISKADRPSKAYVKELNMYMWDVCETIQLDFGKFTKWYFETYKQH